MKWSAPGKLMFSGEWCILEPGFSCIVMAVDKRVFVEIHPAKTITVEAPDLNIPPVTAQFADCCLNWQQDLSPDQNKKIAIVEYAVETALQYISQTHQPRTFSVTTCSKETISETDNSAKLGLGSSAAVCAATVASVLVFHHFPVESETGRELVYKIAALAHYRAQKKAGSGFDIASSTWGGILFYKRFAPHWLEMRLEICREIKEIIDNRWPLLYRKKLTPCRGLYILTGFVGYSADTRVLIAQMRQFSREQPEHYWRIMTDIDKIVRNLERAWQREDIPEVIALLRENRRRLSILGKLSGILLETKELATLADIAESYGGAGKFSGAAGGDCGIAVALNKNDAEKITTAWQKEGITPLKWNIADTGICREKE